MCSSLRRVGYGERDIRALAHNSEFCTIPYKSHEMCFFAEESETIRDHPVSVTELATIFDANKRTVQKQLYHRPGDPAMLEGHAALDDRSESAILASVLQLFQAGKAMTWTELLNVVDKRYDSRFSKGCECIH
jgi:hypothetical protein